MSKELTPLEAFERIKNITYDRTDLYGIEEYRKSLDIIETALKDYENLQLKHRSMTEQVFNDFKELKALEIIKKYIPYYIEIETDENGKFIMTDHEHLVQDELTQEEYDLLKEVLL